MVCGAWVRLRRASSGGPRWSEWSSGRRCGGCTSCAACRSARSIAGPGCIGTRSAARCAATSRRAIGGRRAGSKLDPFKDEIHRLLREDPKLPGQRVRELIAPLGFDGGKTIVDDYLREVRPLFAPPPRTFQRTVYRPGEICQFDLWEPRAEVPVGHGQTRRGWVVVACLGYSRAGAGALIFSKQTPDLLAGIARCLWSLGALPRDAGLGPPGRHPRPRRPADARSSPRSAASCGSTGTSASRADPQAKGVVERLQDFIERSFEPGRAFANELDFQLQLDAWFAERANARHAQDAALPPGRPAARGTRGDGAAAGRGAGHRPALGAPGPARSAPALRHLRLLARPGAGRPARRGARHADREVLAVALDTGELACRHQRSFAKHRTITELEHARALRAGRAEPSSRRSRSGRWRAMTR